MNKRNVVARMGTSVFLLTGFFTASSVVRAAAAPDSEQVTKLLSETRITALQVADDAATMESFTRMNVSMEGHALALAQVREHVNRLAKQVDKLNAAKATASPWQRIAIERVQPFLDELGGYTSAAIEYVNGEQKHTLAEYKDYLEANADYSSDLAAMISDFVNYGKTKARMERLNVKLEIPPTQ